MATEPLHVNVTTALLGALVTPNPEVATSDITSPATPVALPYVAFAPTPGVAYLEARPLMRAAPDQHALAFDAPAMNAGLFQVDAVVPDQAGETVGLRLASLVAARFAAGTTYIEGGYKIQIMRPPVTAAPVKDAPWVRYPVSIPYLVIAA